MIREKRGTIVTVSSVLGQLGAARLSDYTAAKAGVIAMHNSVTAELAPYDEIKTILVIPGQLNTPMFNGMKTPSRFFATILEPVDVVKDIVAVIDGGSSAKIAMPLYARWANWLMVMPVGIQKIVRKMVG